jgi:hypothetical protein
MRLFCSLTVCCYLLAASPSAQAQTCNANMPASTPDNQLTDNGNGTVTDTKTDLVWKKCTEGLSGANCDSGGAGGFTWKTALQQPGVVNGGGGFAGQTDWRLPNIKELRSIVEAKCVNPTINLTRFPNTPSSFVWSGSPNTDYSCYAWGVDFYGGYSGYDYRDYNFQVRLVRGGQ